MNNIYLGAKKLFLGALWRPNNTGNGHLDEAIFQLQSRLIINPFTTDYARTY